MASRTPTLFWCQIWLPVAVEPAGVAVEHVGRAGIGDAAEVLVRDAHGQILAGVAVQVARRHGVAEVVGGLDDLLDAGAVLVPDLVAGRREPAGAAVEHVGRAGIGDGPHVFGRNAHGQLVTPVTVQIARRQGGAEGVERLDDVQDAGAVLVPELVPSPREPAGRRRTAR